MSPDSAISPPGGASLCPREVIRVREAVTRRSIQRSGRYRSSFSCRALRMLRADTDWSQSGLAAAVGLPSKLVSDYENGRKLLSDERLAMLLAALGFSSAEIFPDTRGFLARI